MRIYLAIDRPNGNGYSNPSLSFEFEERPIPVIDRKWASNNIRCIQICAHNHSGCDAPRALASNGFRFECVLELCRAVPCNLRA